MKTKKRALSGILAGTLAILLTVSALAAQDGFGNFTLSDNYKSGQFNDVDGTEWYAMYVENACNYGFLQGKSANAFDPSGLLTLGEAVTLAARLMSIYKTGAADFAESIPFYTAYADYALANGIISSHGDYGSIASRARFAELIYKALPSEAFPEINDVQDYSICDVTPDTGYGAAVYALYRAGVLAGSDRYGTFFPDSSLTRAEACAIMVRLAAPAVRLRMTLPDQIPAETIFRRSSSAVFLIETFDVRNESIRTGSGFFVSDTGIAVTNLHVLESAASATVTTPGGDVFPILGVLAISEKYNLTIISVDSGESPCNYLSIADSDLLEAGSTVYAIGSPLSLINTMTEGIVSNKSRELDGQTFIQFTAPISFGSGGSPVLNTLGQVIGVASSSFSYGQNLNLAVPANFIRELKPGECIPLKEFLER